MYRKKFVILICTTALFGLKLIPVFSADIKNFDSGKAHLSKSSIEKENLRTEYLNKYLLEIQQKIRKLCPDWYGGPQVSFVINSDGNIRNLTMDRNFWNAEATKEFINTIHTAAPFPSLPDGLDHVKIQLPFFPHLGRWGLTLSSMEAEYLNHYSPYIREKIRKDWFPPKDAPLPTLRFIIIPNGNVENLIIGESSKSFSSDDAALNAVRKAVPFPPLPDGLEQVRIELNFNGYCGGYFDGIDPTNTSVVKLNNEAMLFINKGDYKVAIEKLEAAAVKEDPGHRLTRYNLAITNYNYALELEKTNMGEAIKHFHSALFYLPNDSRIRKNLESAIQAIGKDPKSFQDRVELGDKALSERDYIGARVEYEAALSIKNDDGLRAKLGS